MYTTRMTCRLCDGDLVSVLDLGDIHVSTFVDTADSTSPKVPLNLMLCTSCSLVQLQHTVAGSVMYSDYWYQSGLNQSMRLALFDIVQAVKQRIELAEGDIVVDIGANDGTMLGYYPKHVRKIAFEPSNLSHLAKANADVVLNDYFNQQAFAALGVPRAKVITAIAMFYDLEDPHTFVGDLRACLADDGLIVIQLMDLLSMIRTNDFPNICHEHLEYYSLAVMMRLLAQHGLDIIDVEYNNVNGGSIRIYACPTGARTPKPAVQSAMLFEQTVLGNIEHTLRQFRASAESVKRKIVNFIRSAERSEQMFAVMGASTKGNTLLQYFGLTGADIDHAAEINPDKYGKQTIGSNIPIVSDKSSLHRKPDYYLILPWGFLQSFIARYNDYLVAGGAFIVPLPVPTVVCMVNGAIVTEVILEDGSTAR